MPGTRGGMIGRNQFARLISVSLLVLITPLILLIPSCSQEKGTGEKMGVMVTILPLADFVGNIGGEKVDITVMVPPGANVHIYEPTPAQMATLTRAEVYAKAGSGVEFELMWMDKLTAVNKEMLVVDCSRGIDLIEISGEHEHSAPDSHIWMSPRNAKIMVRNIYEGLAQADPENTAHYARNRDAYLQELTELDRDIRNSLSGVTRRAFMVYHPALGYFARDYDLKMLTIEEEGKEPTAADLVRLIEQARESGVKVIFAEPQFNPQSAEVIAEAIEGRVVFIDPLARDYIGNMRNLLKELVQVMK